MHQDTDLRQDYTSKRRQRSVIPSPVEEISNPRNSKSCKHFDKNCKHTFQIQSIRPNNINLQHIPQIKIKMCPDKQTIYDGSATQKFSTFPVLLLDEKPFNKLFVKEHKLKKYVEKEEEKKQIFEQKKNYYCSKKSAREIPPPGKFCHVCIIQYQCTYLEHIKTVTHREKYRNNHYFKLIQNLENELQKDKEKQTRSELSQKKLEDENEIAQNSKTKHDESINSGIKNRSSLFQIPVENKLLFQDQKKSEYFSEKVIFSTKSNLKEDQNIWNKQQTTQKYQSDKQKNDLKPKQQQQFNGQSFDKYKKSPLNLNYTKNYCPSTNSEFKICNFTTKPDESFIQEEIHVNKQQFSSQSIKNICKSLKFDEKQTLQQCSLLTNQKLIQYINRDTSSNKKMIDESQEKLQLKNEQKNLNGESLINIENYKNENLSKKGFQLNKSIFKDRMTQENQKPIILFNDQIQKNNQQECFLNQEQQNSFKYQKEVKENQNREYQRQNKHIESNGFSNSQKISNMNQQNKLELPNQEQNRNSSSQAQLQHNNFQSNGTYSFNFCDLSMLNLGNSKDIDSNIVSNDNKQHDQKAKSKNLQLKNKKRSFQEYNHQRDNFMYCEEEEISITKKFKIFGIGTSEIKSFWQHFKDALGSQLQVIRQKINN